MVVVIVVVVLVVDVEQLHDVGRLPGPAPQLPSPVGRLVGLEAAARRRTVAAAAGRLWQPRSVLALQGCEVGGRWAPEVSRLLIKQTLY